MRKNTQIYLVKCIALSFVFGSIGCGSLFRDQGGGISTPSSSVSTENQAESPTDSSTNTMTPSPSLTGTVPSESADVSTLTPTTGYATPTQASESTTPTHQVSQSTEATSTPDLAVNVSFEVIAMGESGSEDCELNSVEDCCRQLHIGVANSQEELEAYIETSLTNIEIPSGIDFNNSTVLVSYIQMCLEGGKDLSVEQVQLTGEKLKVQELLREWNPSTSAISRPYNITTIPDDVNFLEIVHELDVEEVER